MLAANGWVSNVLVRKYFSQKEAVGHSKEFKTHRGAC